MSTIKEDPFNHGSRQHLSVRVLGYPDLNKTLVHRWAKLEQIASESNAYLSPHFVLPALRRITPESKPVFVFVEDDRENDLLGVGIFERSRGTKRLPLPHLRAYQCPHSYLTGLLIHRDWIKPVLASFFSFFCDPGNHWYGIEFINRYADTVQASLTDEIASQFKIPWIGYSRKKRAVLIPKDSGPAYMEKHFSSKKKKFLRRCYRLLREAGAVRWRIVRGREIDRTCIDTFLRLEDMGWKAEEKTSLLRRRHDQFFREMIEGFARHGRAFFTELILGNKVIASTSNIISGNAGFAFKIGWDAEFARMSPGILNEAEFIRNVPDLFPDLEYIDSGAEEGSFIENLWPDRHTLISGFYVTKKLSGTILNGLNTLRGIRDRAFNLR